MGRKDCKEYKGFVDCKDFTTIIGFIDIKYPPDYKFN